jgi:hypothetical protein
MKQRLISLALLLLLPAILFAKEDRHCLWEVRGNSGKAWLLGSIHVADSSFYPLDDVIIEAYNQSDAMAVEFDVNSVNPAELMQKAIFMDGTTLADALPDTTYHKLDSLLALTGLQPVIYKKFKPWFAAITAAQTQIERCGYKVAMGVDVYFLNQARRDSTKIYELESLDQQIELLDEQISSNIDAFIESTISEADMSDSALVNLMTAWKTGDTTTLREFIYMWEEDFPEYEPIHDKIMIERNHNMASKIDEYIKSGEQVFVIVGVGHLVGAESIIELLRCRGYKIRQI